MKAASPNRRFDPAAALPWACVAMVTGWFAILAVRLPHGDGDLLWQRWLGERVLREHAIPRTLGPETFAAQGAPWTPHEWVFSTTLAWTSAHGANWVVPLLCALAFGVALATVVLRCRRRGISDVMASAAVIACALAAVQSFGARAQVLGWACLAATVWLLELEGPWPWAVVPVTVAWANLHASAFLAPAVAAIVVVAAVVRDRGWSADVRRAATLAVATAAATLVTPFGLELARYSAGLLTSPIRHSISEWGATSASSAAFVAGALPLVLILVLFGARTPARDRLVAVAFAILLFSAVRNVPVFALVAAPIALAAIPRRPARAAGWAPHALAWSALAAVALCAVAVCGFTWRSAPLAGGGLPLGTARALLAQTRTPPRIFCEDFAWCSMFLNEPARFFMDGRCDPYPPNIWREYRHVIDGNRGWDVILDRYRVDAILVRRDSALDSLLAERPDMWRTLDTNGAARLYVHPSVLAKAR